MEFRTISTSEPKFELEGLQFYVVKSPALKRRVDVSLFTPIEARGKKNVPVILLLHGVYGSHWSWLFKGGAHLTLQSLISNGEMEPFVLATPSDGLWGDGSGYVPHGEIDYRAWIGEEVPGLIKREIDCVDDISDFYIGGLSMGGYGAFRVGTHYPQTFKGISGHSSVTDIRELGLFVEEDWSFWDTDQELNSIADLILAAPDRVPPFRFDCGTADELLESNRTLQRQLQAAHVPHQYQEFSGGHEWPYWEQHVKETYLFFNQLYAQS